MEGIIRECGKEDFKEIFRIVNDAAEAYRGRIPDDCWHEPYMSKEALIGEIKSGVVFYGYLQSAVSSPQSAVSSPQSAVYEDGKPKTEDRKLKTEDGRLVGVMGIQEVKDVTLIRHAYVLTEHQGKGVGGSLLKHLLPLAKSGTVLVGTWAAAAWAIRFYEKHGFEPVTPAEKDMLLRKYWRISDRQIETSVVLKMKR